MGTTNTGGDAFPISRSALAIVLMLTERLAAKGVIDADDMAHIRAIAGPGAATSARENLDNLREHLSAALAEIDARIAAAT